MDDNAFPTTTQVRAMHPGELAVLLSTVSPESVAGMGPEAAEAVAVATQVVASWSHAMQAVAVDRFAEHVLHAQEAHARELVAARDALRAQVRAEGGTWRGGSGAVALPEPEQVAASMLAPELRISPRTMRTRLRRARSLTQLPVTLGLALGGVLEPWRVDAVVAAAADVEAQHLVEFEARLYATDVGELPKPRLAERARRAAAKADPDGLARSVARAPARRSLRVGPSATTGLTRWVAEVPDAMSARMLAAVDALAQEYLTADRARTTPDGVDRGRRTVEAARLDALADLVMSNAHVDTLVELVVPVHAGTGDALVTRPDPSTAAAAATSSWGRSRPTPWPPETSNARWGWCWGSGGRPRATRS